MGYNTTVLVLNDALDQIASDPHFGKKLVFAISKLGMGRGPVDVSAGNHANAATVVETHHADLSTLMLIGGNYGSKVGTARGWKHHDREDQLGMLQQVLDEMGYIVVPKSAKNVLPEG